MNSQKSTDDTIAENLINKVRLLETRVGVETKYHIFEPNCLDPQDIIAVNKAARTIAVHAGISQEQVGVIAVAFSHKAETIGGDVEHVRSEDVAFIGISNDLIHFEKAIWATLAHEVSHIFLFVKEISAGVGPAYLYENEILTDITAVFLGFGKLMLNGCISHRSYENQHGQTIKEKQTVGYLKMPQLAFVYRFVCAMRQISRSDYERNLSGPALESIHSIEKQYGDRYFNSKFHNLETHREMTLSLKEEIMETQSLLAKLERDLLFIQRCHLFSTGSFLHKTHRTLSNLCSEVEDKQPPEEHDPSLRYIKLLEYGKEVRGKKEEINDVIADVRKHLRVIENIKQSAHQSQNPFANYNPDILTEVICRNDGTKFQVERQPKPSFVTCPKCRYQFIVHTSLAKLKKPMKSSRTSILKSIVSLFGRKT